jgi:hypothetical protein
LTADLASDRVEEGARVGFEVARPVVIEGMTVIPVGAVAWGAVQSVKIGKFIEFDIEGVQLPDGTNVKLRSVGVRAKKPWQDRIKVDSSFPGGVGAANGSEYTAYFDEERQVAVSGPASNPALAAAPSAAPTAPPTQAPTPPPIPVQGVVPSPSTATPPVTSATPTAPPPVATPAPPAVTTAAAPAPATPAQAPPAATTPAVTAPAVTTPAPPATSPAASATPSAALASVERVRVECFSDPPWADILIDGEFYGNTPSMLKIPVGKHDLEIQLSGYKTYSRPLILQSGTGILTIRAPLEAKE